MSEAYKIDTMVYRAFVLNEYVSEHIAGVNYLTSKDGKVKMEVINNPVESHYKIMMADKVGYGNSLGAAMQDISSKFKI